MKPNYSEWYQRVGHQLSGHGIWLRGEELNTCKAQDFESSSLRILVTRLSTSRDTSASFTHKILYQLAVKQCGAFADMAFLPPPGDSEIFDRDGVPWLLGTTTKRDASQFDLIAISNSIVQELINLPVLLRKSSIPLSKKERMSRNDIPLIILGGANALNTSLLLSDDPLVDGIFAGEDPDCIVQLFNVCKDMKGHSKEECLRKMQEVPGFFQPDNSVPTIKQTRPELDPVLLLEGGPVLYEEEQPGRGNLQISDGCASFCSFCAESWNRKPYREFTSKMLLDASLRMKASMGLDSVDLYSFNFNMHGEFYPLLWNLHSIFSTVGLKSQRFDFVADDYQLPGILHAAGKSSVTCGLEGISSRLRSYLHKSLDDRRLRSSLNILLRTPLRELKIFLIATGLEDDSDYQELKELLTFINESMESAGRKPRIIFSMTPLVRFPFTPLEFEPAPEVSHLKGIIEQVERLIRCRGFEFRTAAELPEYAVSQILCRADQPGILSALQKTCEETGFIYYESVSREFMNAFALKLEDEKISFKSVLTGSSWTKESRVPVKLNVRQDFIDKISEECKDFIDDGYCMGTAEREGSCYNCGSCAGSISRDRIISLREKSVYTAEKLRLKIRDAESKTVLIPFKIKAASKKRGIQGAVIASALASAVMVSERRLVEGYRGFASGWVSDRFLSPWVYGDDIITLKWDSTSAELIRELVAGKGFIDIINQRFSDWGFITGLSESVPTDVSLILRSPYRFDGNEYFRKNALKYISRKTDDGVLRHEFTPQSLKKKIIQSLETVKYGEHGSLVTIKPSEKFDLLQFLKGAFPVQNDADLVNIEIECRF